jgi:transcriptional regulator with XRE-family HTH domain
LAGVFTTHKRRAKSFLQTHGGKMDSQKLVLDLKALFCLDSDEKLARKLRVSGSTISAWKHGRRNPSARILEDIEAMVKRSKYKNAKKEQTDGK